MSAFPHMSEALPQLASPDEVAEYLGLKPATVVIMCRNGRLPAVKVGHRWHINIHRLAEQLGQVPSVPTRTGPGSSDNGAGSGTGEHRRGAADLAVPAPAGAPSAADLVHDDARRPPAGPDVGGVRRRAPGPVGGSLFDPAAEEAS